MLSPARQTLIGSAVIPLGVWAAAAPRVAEGFDRGYSSGLSAFLTGSTVVAVALTIGALALVIQSWRGKMRPLYPGVVSALATASVLFLSVAMGLAG
jgi:predicted exporter